MKKDANLLMFTVVFSALLSGCATTPTTKSGPDTTDLLYDGKAATLYEARTTVKSSAEAMDLANSALQVGDIDRALYRYITAYELDPESYEALYKVGAIHAKQGHLDRAALAFDMVLKQEPDHAATLEELGLIDIRRRRYQKARGHLNKAVEENPKLWRALNGLGVLADLDKDFDTAKEYYGTALKLYPGSPMILNNLGYSEYLQGHWQRAQSYIEAALDRNPGYKKALLNLGLILVREGAYERAVAAFDRVMDRSRSYERIGALCMAEGKYDAAEHYLNLAISTSPTYYKEAFAKLEQLTALRTGAIKSRVSVPEPPQEPKRFEASSYDLSFMDVAPGRTEKDGGHNADESLTLSRLTLDRSLYVTTTEPLLADNDYHTRKKLLAQSHQSAHE